MKKFLLGTLCFFTLSVEAGNLRAIVNDVPVSEWDVKMHARLLKAQQPTVYGEMSSQKLNKEALDNLIEEILKAQKGKELNLSLSDREVDEAIVHLEQQNGMSVGGLKRLLDKEGVSMQALRKQVYGDLMWLQYIKSKSNQVSYQVPESAVKERLRKIKADKYQGYLAISERNREIYIAFHQQGKIGVYDAETVKLKRKIKSNYTVKNITYDEELNILIAPSYFTGYVDIFLMDGSDKLLVREFVGYALREGYFDSQKENLYVCSENGLYKKKIDIKKLIEQNSNNKQIK